WVCVGRLVYLSFFFSSRRRHTRFSRDWSSDVCSSDLALQMEGNLLMEGEPDRAGADAGIFRRLQFLHPAKDQGGFGESSGEGEFPLLIDAILPVLRNTSDTGGKLSPLSDPFLHLLHASRQGGLARGRGFC